MAEVVQLLKELPAREGQAVMVRVWVVKPACSLLS
jgi:hypothetical protein